MSRRIYNPVGFFAAENASRAPLTPAELARAAAEDERRNRWNEYRNALTRDGYSWDEAHSMTVAHFAAIDHNSADDAADANQE